MLALASPAAAADCAEVLAPDGGCHRALWRCIRAQLAAGPSYAMRDEQGRALAVCGFYSGWTDYVEIWVALAPAARGRMREIVGMARLTLADQEQDDPRPFAAIVRTPAGRRIAVLLGFTELRPMIFVRERTM